MFWTIITIVTWNFQMTVSFDMIMTNVFWNYPKGNLTFLAKKLKSRMRNFHSTCVALWAPAILKFKVIVTKVLVKHYWWPQFWNFEPWRQLSISSENFLCIKDFEVCIAHLRVLDFISCSWILMWFLIGRTLVIKKPSRPANNRFIDCCFHETCIT